MATACGAPSSPENNVMVVVPVQGSAAPPLVSPSTESEARAPAREGDPTPLPTPSAEGGLVAPSVEGNGGVGYVGPMCRGGRVVRPQVCADDQGSPGDCNKAHCALGFVCQQCEAYKRYFKPKIAERAVACVVAQTRKQAADGCRTYQCGDEALKSACLDPSVDNACLTIARRCNTSLDECRGLLSGMNDAGRRKIAACAARGCPYGLWSCVEGI
jgi:hypothetical protein